jgi:hypothetical protein
MKSDKDRFLTLKKERDGLVSFGNDNSTIIIGKGTVKIEIQMCHQGHILMFHSKKCEVRKEKSGKLVSTTIRTPRNIYVLMK